MFCAPGLIFGGIEGVGSRFHVLRARNHFRRYRGHQVPFSCFALPDSFSAVLRASGPVFTFRAAGLIFSGTRGVGCHFLALRPELIFGGIVSVGSRFHVLRSRTSFRRYRWCRVRLSRFVLPESFSALPRASGPVFMFCAPELFFRGTESVGSLLIFMF
jgi:hypothetical protein